MGLDCRKEQLTSSLRDCFEVNSPETAMGMDGLLGDLAVGRVKVLGQAWPLSMSQLTIN